MIGRFAAVCLGLMAAAGPVAAQQIDLSSGGPIEVTARDGFEWRENEQLVIATGDARAVRDNVTVIADRLIAHYRKKGPAGAGSAPVAAQPASAAGEPDSGGNEIYRLEADGHVRIFTPTDQAQADHAIYDIDQAVLVMTGSDLRLTTPTQVMTARDSMEYWSQKHMAVGRGNAVVVTSDARRIAADTLVGYTNDQSSGAPKLAASSATPAKAGPDAKADPLAGSGKLQRAEAYGNVEVRTPTEIVRGDRGLYLADTQIARIVGHVRITRGQEQVNGAAADVNMKTGIAHLVSTPGGRVQGLIVPNDPQNKATDGQAKPPQGQPGAQKPPQPGPAR